MPTESTRTEPLACDHWKANDSDSNPHLISECGAAGGAAGLAPGGGAGGRKLLLGDKVLDSAAAQNPLVGHRCLTPEGNAEKLGNLPRSSQWSLPLQALPIDYDTTIHCLVLRYNFQYEETDDPNTTGRGRMDLSRPLDTLSDEEYVAREGHIIDPPPHDSLYFDAHMRALARFWEFVSEGRVHLTWDIYPPFRDSVYTLPQPMNHYGRCDFSEVVEGLEYFFIDCLQLADTAHLLHPGDEARWDIDFGDYQAFFMFHAGSDRQSDIGFPVTCNDLFTGFIRFGGSVAVDGGTVQINTGLMMPETVVQDNRVTALNAVMAHEFGHQLGLIDVYDTRNFMTQLGDYALMDNNGFGTGIDFGFPKGKVFGTSPVYPCAWSRAYLGFVDVVDVRSDTTGVALVAGPVPGDSLPAVARIPISENEYYLLENRLVEADGKVTALLADSITSVIQGPVNLNRQFTGEYDFLAPGSGMMITLIDDEVASLDYNRDGDDNFYDNQLQWYMPSQGRKFIKLIEADGLVGFGGNYRVGYGNENDLYRDDRNSSLTPNTNPPAIDNTGANTHVYVTNIRRDTIPGGNGQRDDRLMLFDLEIDRKVAGFPVRVGEPKIPIAAIADDLDGDGEPEVIAVANDIVTVVTSDGRDFIRTKSACDTITCPLIYDTVVSTVNNGLWFNPAAEYVVPVYYDAPSRITAGPVTGDFGSGSANRLVAIGYTSLPNGRLAILEPVDDDGDAEADLARASIAVSGTPLAMSFGDVLYVLTSTGAVYRLDSLNGTPTSTTIGGADAFYGICRVGQSLAVVFASGDETHVELVGDLTGDIALDGDYQFGPVVIDMNRDNTPEIVLFSVTGDGVYVSVDTVGGTASLSILAEHSTGNLVSTNPVAADLDGDGYPEIIVGGVGQLYAYDDRFTMKTDFPLDVDDRFPDSLVIAAPVVANVSRGGMPEIVFPGSAGNMYGFGLSRAFGFPFPSGRQKYGVSGSSPAYFHDSTGGKLVYLGGDGWLYAWQVDVDSTTEYWPMTGGDPTGSFVLATSKLSATKAAGEAFAEDRFYNYPNPVMGDSTIIRYYLDGPADRVTLKFYDMSGERVDELEGTTYGSADNEVIWRCTDIVPGVYRCVIDVDYPGGTANAFTDIAVVR